VTGPKCFSASRRAKRLRAARSRSLARLPAAIMRKHCSGAAPEAATSLFGVRHWMYPGGCQDQADERVRGRGSGDPGRRPWRPSEGPVVWIDPERRYTAARQPPLDGAPSADGRPAQRALRRRNAALTAGGARSRVRILPTRPSGRRGEGASKGFDIRLCGELATQRKRTRLAEEHRPSASASQVT